MTPIIDSFGLWWFKGSRKKISGRLQYNEQNGVILEFVSTYIGGNPFENKKDLQIIYGVLSNGKKVTLFECYYRNRTFAANGIVYNKYFAKYLIIGSILKDFNKEKFRKVAVEYQNLKHWARITGIEGGLVVRSDIVGLEMKYSQPKDEVILDNKDIKITLSVNSKISVDFLDTPVEETNIVIIEAKKKHDFSYFHNYIIQIQDFLTLALNLPCFINEINIVHDLIKEEKIVNRSLVLYQPSYETIHEDKKYILHDTFFIYDNFKKEINFILAKWISLNNTFIDSIRLYFSNIYRPNQFLDIKFSNLINAIESFHREKFGGSYESVESFTNETYLKLVEAIPTKLSIDYQENIKSKMKWLNEISLRSRLKSLLSEYEELIVPQWNSVKMFVDDVVSTRNYYTHYTSELKSVVEQKDNLYELYSTLERIMKCILLIEIGIPKEYIMQRLKEIKK